MRVGIIGGGIIGFSCALRIQDRFKDAADITVISEAFSPNTTGDGSAGLWGPYLVAGTPTKKVYKWSKDMHDFLEKLWLSEDAGEAGVCLIPNIRVTDNKQERIGDIFWKDIVYGCVPLTQKQLKECNELLLDGNNRLSSGINFLTYTSEPQKLLPYLMKLFEKNGGKVIQRKVENLQNFVLDSPYDAIINCTGLGAKDMLDDAKSFAIRGQVTRVKANWLYYVYLDESDDGNYIIPNVDSVVLGGTHQVHDYNTKVCPYDKKFIVNGCQKLVPALEKSEHLSDWVGLRPGRQCIRLEVDEYIDNKIVIHNYGHGGCGITLAWGCAEDVLQLLEAELRKRNVVKAKL